eukprot:6212208-Pleurochrysis_carterae.AAC.2
MLGSDRVRVRAGRGSAGRADHRLSHGRPTIDDLQGARLDLTDCAYMLDPMWGTILLENGRPFFSFGFVGLKRRTACATKWRYFSFCAGLKSPQPYTLDWSVSKGIAPVEKPRRAP